MPEITIDIPIARTRAEVHAWWTGFPDDYRASDPREQPHRIKVLERGTHRVELLTYWRMPLGIEVVIPETLHLHPDGNFSIDVRFPLGLRQRDDFTLRAEGERTVLTVRLAMTATNPVARLLVPLYWHLYGVRMYPRMFHVAGKLCERDAPRLGGGGHTSATPAG